jgi:hypothetical protein
MRHCVINFGKGGNYPQGSARLAQSLKDTNYPGQLFIWTDESQLGAPFHSQSPYAFKMAAFHRAAAAGFDTILWCDSAVWAWHDIMPIMHHIDQHGHVIFVNGWNCAQWTSDACLKKLGVSRDEAEKMTHIIGGCLGLSMKSERSKEFLRQLTACSLDGVSFPGPWTNNGHLASADPRCLGHRHDQAVGSILAAKLGMELIIPQDTYFSYYVNPKGTAFVYGQQNDMSMIKPNVSLLVQGL